MRRSTITVHQFIHNCWQAQVIKLLNDCLLNILSAYITIYEPGIHLISVCFLLRSVTWPARLGIRGVYAAKRP
jgi:hypothetical protein